MWTDERALIEALIELIRNDEIGDAAFMAAWRAYAYGANPQPLTEEDAMRALDWLKQRLEGQQH